VIGALQREHPGQRPVLFHPLRGGGLGDHLGASAGRPGGSGSRSDRRDARGAVRARRPDAARVPAARPGSAVRASTRGSFMASRASANPRDRAARRTGGVSRSPGSS
jgi:hypothetical protein